MIKNVFLYIILILSLNSCIKSKEKLKSSKFLYVKDRSSIELKIINEKDYLIYDIPTRVDFKWNNIDPKTSSIYGAGIKILEVKNNIIKTEIDVPSNYLKNDTLNIKLSFEINREKINTEFNIPVKNNANGNSR